MHNLRQIDLTRKELKFTDNSVVRYVKVFSRIWRRKATRTMSRTTIYNACRRLRSSRHPEEGLSNLTLKFEPHVRALKPQKTDLLHRVNDRGGLGPTHEVNNSPFCRTHLFATVKRIIIQSEPINAISS